MRDLSVRSPLDASSSQTEHADLQVTTVVAVAAAAAAIVCPTLVALTHGWDYRLAVVFGALVAVGLARFGWRRLPVEDGEGRLSLEFAGALAAMLVCVYAADLLDWSPLGIDDAYAGMAIGLVLIVLGPARRALYLAGSMPAEASFTLMVLTVAPAGWAYFAHAFRGAELDDVQAYQVVQLAGFCVSLALAWLGTTFALLRGLYGTAFVLSTLFGLALFAILAGSGVPFAGAAYFGAVGGVCLLILTLFEWEAAAFRGPGHPGTLLVGLAIAGAAALALGAQPVAWFTAAGALATWWWGYYRNGLPLIEPGRLKGADVRRSLVSGALTGSFWILLAAHGFLVAAAASNFTGPMVLAAIRGTGLYTVSDLTFSAALLADQYLWRDELSPPRRIAAASPERLVRLLRHERDSWSGAQLVAARQAFESRKATGVGLEIGAEDAEGWRVAYVYRGSPAEAAGVRRGDVIRAVNGIAVDALRTGRPAGRPQRADSTQLELASPGRAPREVTIAWAEYSKPVVSVEKVIDVAGRRVGYIVLQHFLGAAGDEFSKAAAGLVERGIDELVLDLRMNPGGGVHNARVIASAIGGSRLDGRTFQRLVHNERYRDRDRDIAFRAPERGVLSLPRVFVITSEDTCSASEALINGLVPHMTVVTVGTTTCGKPVGSNVVEYGERAYSVITFRVLNARGEGDYFGGLRPTCPAEDDVAHDLGDPAEASLQAALHYIRFGRCPDRSAAAPAPV